MRGNLSVRIDDGQTDRIVTSRTKGLRFRKTAPGGHHSASCALVLPRNTFPGLGPADKLYIYDSRNAATIWEGYTENPGATDGPAGQSFELSAMGGMILTQDMSTPVVFMERSLDDDLWPRVDNVTPGGTDSVTEGAPLFQFPSGTPVGPGSRVSRRYIGLEKASQRLYSVRADVRSGKIDAGYEHRFDTTFQGVSQEIAMVQPWVSGTTTPVAATVFTNFPIGRDGVLIRELRNGAATNVADDLTWGRFEGLRLRPILSLATGADDFVTVFNPYAVLAHQVVNHVVGKMLPLIDGANARVDTATAEIQQLTYHEGATPQKILDDLALYEPDFLWEILETGANGKHRFAYRAWPTTPRYEISTKDGYSAPGGDADLCNRIVVYYTDEAGIGRSVISTQVVPELAAAGRTRDADPITIPPNKGVASDAARVGAMALSQKRGDTPKAATAVVRRPILDNLRGCMVMPWEIEPGYPVRVRETGEDLRLTEMEYADDSCSATLTLGTPALSVEQILARLLPA